MTLVPNFQKKIHPPPYFIGNSWTFFGGGTALCVIFMIFVSLENVKKCVLGSCTITSKTKINVFWNVFSLHWPFSKMLILAFEANSALFRENETKIVKITHSVESERKKKNRGRRRRSPNHLVWESFFCLVVNTPGVNHGGHRFSWENVGLIPDQTFLWMSFYFSSY